MYIGWLACPLPVFPSRLSTKERHLSCWKQPHHSASGRAQVYATSAHAKGKREPAEGRPDTALKTGGPGQPLRLHRQPHHVACSPPSTRLSIFWKWEQSGAPSRLLGGTRWTAVCETQCFAQSEHSIPLKLLLSKALFCFHFRQAEAWVSATITWFFLPQSLERPSHEAAALPLVYKLGSLPVILTPLYSIPGTWGSGRWVHVDAWELLLRPPLEKRVFPATETDSWYLQLPSHSI